MYSSMHIDVNLAVVPTHVERMGMSQTAAAPLVDFEVMVNQSLTSGGMDLTPTSAAWIEPSTLHGMTRDGQGNHKKRHRLSPHGKVTHGQKEGGPKWNRNIHQPPCLQQSSLFRLFFKASKGHSPNTGGPLNGRLTNPQISDGRSNIPPAVGGRGVGGPQFHLSSLIRKGTWSQKWISRGHPPPPIPCLTLFRRG